MTWLAQKWTDRQHHDHRSSSKGLSVSTFLSHSAGGCLPSRVEFVELNQPVQSLAPLVFFSSTGAMLDIILATQYHEWQKDEQDKLAREAAQNALEGDSGVIFE